MLGTETNMICMAMRLKQGTWGHYTSSFVAKLLRCDKKVEAWTTQTTQTTHLQKFDQGSLGGKFSGRWVEPRPWLPESTQMTNMENICFFFQMETYLLFCIFKSLIWEVWTVLGIVMVRQLSFHIDKIMRKSWLHEICFTVWISWKSLTDLLRSHMISHALMALLRHFTSLSRAKSFTSFTSLASQVVKPVTPTAMPSSPS